MSALLSLFLSFGAIADPPSVHGMFLFDDMLASHLPMFHKPHDYQLIMQLELDDVAKSQYRELRNQGHEFFTLVPEVMDLNLIYTGQRKNFNASIYVGHFERGGELAMTGIQVTVQEILFSQRLVGVHSDNFEQEYVVFESLKGKKFAAHVIEERPGFDWIAEVESDAPQGSRLKRSQAGALSSLSEGQSIDGLQVKKVLYFETGDLAH